MHHTRVVHFELPADNEERAKSFYQKVFGWDISKYPGMEYHVVGTTEVDPKTRMPTQPGAINGGLTKRNNEVKNTVITVDVPDIEAALKNIEKLGGKTVQKKQPVTDMGFTAYFKDTEGNIVGSGLTRGILFLHSAGALPESYDVSFSVLEVSCEAHICYRLLLLDCLAA